VGIYYSPVVRFIAFDLKVEGPAGAPVLPVSSDGVGPSVASTVASASGRASGAEAEAKAGAGAGAEDEAGGGAGASADDEGAGAGAGSGGDGPGDDDDGPEPGTLGFLGYDDMVRVFEAFRIPYVKPAFRGPYIDAVKWAVEHAADPAEVDEGTCVCVCVA
jgi:hypothetical protein